MNTVTNRPIQSEFEIHSPHTKLGANTTSSSTGEKYS